MASVAADQSGAVDPSVAAVTSDASTEEASGAADQSGAVDPSVAAVTSDASTEEASGAAVPCPANSGFNQLAKLRIGNKNVDELRKSPSKEIMDDALLLAKTPDEIIDMYVNCIAQNPEPSAPPVDENEEQAGDASDAVVPSQEPAEDANNGAGEGGRKRSRKHRNRRGSRTKSKRSRKNSRSKSKRSRRGSRSKSKRSRRNSRSG